MYRYKYVRSINNNCNKCIRSALLLLILNNMYIKNRKIKQLTFVFVQLLGTQPLRGMYSE